LDFRHDAALQGSAPRKARERLSQKKTQFARTGDVVRRQIADEIILVPVRQSAEDLDSIYSINPMAAQIWDLLDGQRTLGDIRDLLLQDYNVTPAELDRDIAEFVEQLMSEKLIREA
jgi:hypothetical protein